MINTMTNKNVIVVLFLDQELRSSRDRPVLFYVSRISRISDIDDFLDLSDFSDFLDFLDVLGLRGISHMSLFI